MKLSRNGRAVIAEHCSPAVMAARMAELLDDPLPANRPSSTVELLPQPAR
jgi:hypothetical protein